MSDQFRAALVALFGADPVQQQAANIWLNEFSKTTEAWSCALSLLDPGSGATLEQAFFAANMLASKTRSDWARLSPHQRSELADTYLAKLRGLMLSGGPAAAAAVSPVLVDRVTLLAASAAALGGAPAAERHMACALEVAAAARAALAAEHSRAGGEALLRCSLLMLQQLAEEAEGLDSVRRHALLSGPVPASQEAAGSSSGSGGGLMAQRGGVVAMAREVLVTAAAGTPGGGGGGGGAAAASPGKGEGGGGGGGGSGPNLSLVVAAVRCLGAWVRLEDSGSSGCGLSPAELEVLSPGLTRFLLGLLALPPPGPPTSSPLSAAANVRQQQQPALALYQAAADLAVDLLGPGGRTCTATAGGEAADAAATASAVEAVVQLGRQLAAAAEAEAAAEAAAGASPGCGAALAALVAAVRVAVGVAERNVGELATRPSGDGAVELAKTVVAALAACPARREVAEAATDYFLAINTVPTAERHPALGAPLYSALLPYIMRAVSYPPGFRDWESEVDEDEEAFYRFREQQAAELLETMYGQCRTALVAQLVDAAVSWSPASAAAAPNGLRAAGAEAGSGSLLSPGARGAGDWRPVEAALFCLRAIHLPVKAAALGGRAGELDSPAAAATAAELHGLLGRLFNDVCSPSGRVASLLGVPWVALAASRLIAEYAAWLGKAKDAPLESALGLLLRALAVPQAAGAAAQAFRNCCVRGSDPLTAQPPTLAALATAAMAVVAPAPPVGGGAAAAVGLSLEERSTVVEGLARLVAKLPADAAAEAGCSLLMAPCVARAQSIAAAAAAAGGPLSAATLAALASELGVMTATVRFLEFPSLAGPARHPLHAAVVAAAAAAAAAGGGSPGAHSTHSSTEHPALRVLQIAWPVLSAIAAEPQCQGDAGVVEALAELYKRSLLSTKLAGRPLLPPLISSLLAVLRVRPHAAVLDVLCTVVEVFGEVAHSEETRALQVTALKGAVQMMGSLVAHLQQQQQQHQHQQQQTPSAASTFPSASSPGELAAAFFTLADRHLVFDRELLLADPEGAAAIPALVEWACGVLLLMREREPAAAALAFLTHLLSAATQVSAEAASTSSVAASGAATAAANQELRARLDSQVAAAGPRLVHSLLAAGSDTCPRQLMRPLSGCLYGLVALANAGTGGDGGESAVRSGLPGWLRSAWGQPPLADVIQSGRLGEGGAHAARFTELLLRGHYPSAAGLGAAAPLPRGRLDALVGDFFAVARGEATEDVLLAYEL